MTSVFISHSSRNNDTARDLRKWLRKQGFEAPFLDIDPEAGLQPGDDWERRLYESIDHCQALLIVLTPEWLASKWCFAEFTQARAFGKPVLPLIHAGVSDEDLRSFAPQIQRLDLRRERVAGMTRLGEALTQISLSSGQGYEWPPKSDRDRSSYLGLESYPEEDAAVFCGRDDEIRAVLEHLHARRVQWGQTLLMVVGSRRAGKSSLLRAGVIPRLKRLAKQWIVLPPFRPHPDPCGALAASLSQCGGRGGWDAVRQRLLDADSSNDLHSTWLRMAKELQEHASSPNARILIAIDQGEELVSEASEPYPQPKPGRWIVPLSALGLLLGALSGVLFTGPEAKAGLVRYGTSLLQWLPVLYGILALSNAGRYWRWRLLLGSLRIGRPRWPDLLGWFRGFALTATPAKLGELSRVQLLHEQLGYPQLPLVHVFVAERCADVAAVALLLLVLTPAQVLGLLPSVSSSLLLGLVLVALVAALLVRSPAPRRWLQTRWQQWRHHLPSGTLARATVPAALISVQVWGNEALVLWLLVRLLAPSPITIPAAIAIYLLSGTAGMASSLPGGIGVNEGATVLLLAQQGVPAAVALPIAVLRRVITLWSMVALAAAVGVLPFSGVGQLRRDS